MTNQREKRAVVVVAFVAGIVFLVRLGSIVFPSHTGRIDPRINLTGDVNSQIAERQRQQQIRAFVSVNEGEVSRTEERIREATALAAASTVCLTNEVLNRRVPFTVGDLASRLNTSGLLPPGVQVIGANGEASSSHAKLFLRYRSEPLGVEILSLGKVPLDGPALLVRVAASEVPSSEKQSAQ